MGTGANHRNNVKTARKATATFFFSRLLFMWSNSKPLIPHRHWGNSPSVSAPLITATTGATPADQFAWTVTGGRFAVRRGYMSPPVELCLRSDVSSGLTFSWRNSQRSHSAFPPITAHCIYCLSAGSRMKGTVQDQTAVRRIRAIPQIIMHSMRDEVMW